MSLRFVQFAFAASEEANYQSSFHEVSPCETSLYEAKDFALKFAVQCEGFRPKLRRMRRKMFSPKSSPCEAKDILSETSPYMRRRVFRPKVRRARRKMFSPETSPYEAKGVFALNFAVRSERRFRPKVRRMRRKVFSPKTSPYEAKDIFARKFALIQHGSYP